MTKDLLIEIEIETRSRWTVPRGASATLQYCGESTTERELLQTDEIEAKVRSCRVEWEEVQETQVDGRTICYVGSSGGPR